MRILGIDPGSRFCGFGVVEDAGGGRLLHVAHGVIELEAEGPIGSRLRRLFERLTEELGRHRPEMVAIEDIFHSRNARSALVLGQARGVALLAAALSGAEVRSFAASVVKQAVTGSGRAEKQQVARMVDALLGVRVTMRADASDALAIALCGALRGPAAGSPKSGARRGSKSGSASESMNGSASGAGRQTPAAANLQRLIQDARGRSKPAAVRARSVAKWRRG